MIPYFKLLENNEAIVLCRYAMVLHKALSIDPTIILSLWTDADFRRRTQWRVNICKFNLANSQDDVFLAANFT